GKSVGVVDETATGSANFFWSRSVLPMLRRGPYRSTTIGRDAPAPAEHRPGSHRSHLGGRACGLHLLLPARRRRERRDLHRDLARRLRRDLALRATARRGRATPPRPQAFVVGKLGSPAAGRLRGEREQQLPSQLAPELELEPLARGSGLRIEALEVGREKARPPFRRRLR